ncbi:MAG: sulfatase-like hydrolase/transferase [Candidatus Omnitrophica bacterium]|nr:sulfatase-like hydrolase/transferase [Candidatus Omnitrophota bacterium]
MANQCNLLFLYTDEQAFDTMATYGNQLIEMPALNALASESTVFDQAYVSQPVCTPSRSTILTGLYPHQNGCLKNNIPLPANVRCLPEMITGNYVTGHFGKWHLGDEVFPQHGFIHWRSIEDLYWKYYQPGRDPKTRSSYHHFLISHGIKPSRGEIFSRTEVTCLPEELSKPAYLAEESCGFIKEYRSQPFLLYVNFLEPHMPFSGPRNHQYNPEKIPLPENFSFPPGQTQPLKTRLFHAWYKEKWNLKTPANWKELRARYWGLCSLIDTQVGRILQTLKECGLWDKTIIVFTSDHGDMMGAHQLVAKSVLFEEAIRVPLLIKIPGQKYGRRISGPVSQIDLVPTLLDLLAQPIPHYLPGKSLRSVLENSRQNQINSDIFVEWNGNNCVFVPEIPGKAGLSEPLPDLLRQFGTKEELEKAIADPVRTIVTSEGWKFNWSQNGEHELYNLRDDPGETTNRYNHPGYQSVVKKLEARILQWQRETEDNNLNLA